MQSTKFPTAFLFLCFFASGKGTYIIRSNNTQENHRREMKSFAETHLVKNDKAFPCLEVQRTKTGTEFDCCSCFLAHDTSNSTTKN